MPGLALFFPAPDSYTGEHVLELQGHGGSVVQEALTAASHRAWCNGALCPVSSPSARS